MGSGGPSKEQLAMQQQQLNENTQVTQAQLDLQRQQFQQSQVDLAQRQALQQPLIAKEQALAGGDRNAALAAAMPSIMNLSQGYNASKESIMSSLPPGAARDQALAALDTQKYVGTGAALAGQVQQAPEVLANIGSGLGAFSLQEVGASLSGLQGASSSSLGGFGAVSQQEQMQAQAKANQLGFIGGLVGDATSLATGGLGKFSDLRLKSNIVTLHDILQKIAAVRVATFDYASGEENQTGVIAQELQRLFPGIVRPYPGINGETYYQVDYGQLAAVAVQGVKELKAKCDFLEMELNNLSQYVKSLQQAGKVKSA